MYSWDFIALKRWKKNDKKTSNNDCEKEARQTKDDEICGKKRMDSKMATCVVVCLYNFVLVLKMADMIRL